jgi:hypothetical protein
VLAWKESTASVAQALFPAAARTMAPAAEQCALPRFLCCATALISGYPEDEDSAMRRALPVLICLLLMSPAVLSEQFYKWQDEKGVWHYSAKAPKDQPADKLKVRSSSGSGDADAEEGEEEEKPAAKGETPESANCKAAKSNLEILNNNQTVSKDLDGDGEAENLSLEQHQEEIAFAERQIAAFCKPDKPAADEAETETETE